MSAKTNGKPTIAQQVATDTGMAGRAIGQMECGVVYGSVLNICILAAYYGVSVDWLLGDEWR